jgi:hypothetical protein
VIYVTDTAAASAQSTPSQSTKRNPASRVLHSADATAADTFDTFGNYVNQFGCYGTGNGQFRTPYGIAIAKQ